MVKIGGNSYEVQTGDKYLFGINLDKIVHQRGHKKTTIIK